MRSTFRVLTSLAALGAAVCVSSASFAQEPPPGAGPPPPVEQQAGHEHWAERMKAHAEARARELRAILNLRPDQEAAFQAFLASMKPEHPPGERGRPGMGEEAQLTTPQRLDRMAARMAEHQAEFQRRAAAIKTFYAALSPEQQRAFDALHGMMGHGPGGPDRDGPGHDGPGPHGMDRGMD